MKKFFLFFFCSSLLFGVTNVLVTSAASSGAGTLHEAIFTVVFAGDTENHITFDPGLTITLSTPLPPIYLANTTDTLTIIGNSTTIDGSNAYRGFFAQRGTVTIADIGCQNILAKGGNSGNGVLSGGTGGGGLGAGGGCFVGNEATVTLSGVTFTSVGAQGGSSGSAANPIAVRGGGSGGGGVGGNSGVAAESTGGGGYFGNSLAAGSRGGGGGGGMFGNSGNNSTSAVAGGGGGGGVQIGQNGSNGASPTGGNGGGAVGGSGGAAKTNGSPGGAFNVEGGGGGGGGGSITNDGPAGNGGAGGFGGGGGSGGEMNGIDGVSADNRVGSGGNGGLFGGGGGCGIHGGSASAALPGRGGDGGDYGGGGGSTSLIGVNVTPSQGGNGGWGGGGGGSGGSPGINVANGGDGGFGAGGGGSGGLAGGGGTSFGGVGGTAGLGGGNGGTGILNQGGSGGGGAALGAVIFIRPGGSLVLDSDIPVGALTAGTAGTAGAGSAGSNGEAFGTSIFINGNTTLTVGGALGTRTIAGTIADDQSLTQGTGAKGNGGLTKVGANTVALSAANTYTGGTIISEGTLLIGNSASMGTGNSSMADGSTLSLAAGISPSNNISIAGTSTFNVASGTATLSGMIGNSGSLAKTGDGTLTLTGANTYSGTTTISEGTLVGNTTSLQGASNRTVVNNATLNFDQGSDASYNGAISGTGTLIKQNTGSLEIETSFIQSALNVTGGTLAVNAIGTVMTTTVSAGATLMGTGPLGAAGGTVVVAGTMAPGNSIGTTTIIGDFTQASGSTLEIELNPSGADQLLVSGIYTIEPNAILSLLPEFGTYAPHTVYPIVTAAGGVLGTFSPVTSSLPSLNFEVFYLPGEVLLLLNIVPFNNLNLTGNGAQVAACLDGATVVQGSDLDLVIDELRFMDMTQMQRTVDQMQPSLFNAFDLASQETLLNVEGILSSKVGFACEEPCQKTTKKNVWIQYYYNRAKQDSIESQVGFATQTQSGALGADWNFVSQHSLGAMLAYSRDSLSWEQSYGNGKIQSYTGALQFNWRFPVFYAQLGILGAFQEFDGNRNILFEGVLFDSNIRTATSSSYGGSFLPSVEIGAKFGTLNAKIIPFAKADYVYNYRGSFLESGANSLDLKVESHQADLLRFEGGLQGTFCAFSQDEDVCSQKKLAVLFAKVAGVREQRFLGKSETAQLASSNCELNVNGMSPDRWLIASSVGITLNQKVYSFTFSGEGLWGKNYRSYLGQGEIKISF